MFNARTDLAIEATAVFNKEKDDINRLDGVEADIVKRKNIVITRVDITNENGSKNIGKPIGTYITLDSPLLREHDDENFNDTSRCLCEELKHILSKHKFASALVVGLGNWNVTPDALGPKVVSNLLVTRHLFSDNDGVKTLSAISPGVLGITGIETGEIIKGVCERTKPDIVIAIDALASRKMERISTTIQICDTGIIPGSGIGNHRQGITEDFLGVPVIAIGVPTVVDAATVANDSIEILIENIKKYASEDSSLKKSISVFENDNRYVLIKEVLSPYVGELVVTPKEVDLVIDDVSKIIANAINDVMTGENQNMKNVL